MQSKRLVAVMAYHAAEEAVVEYRASHPHGTTADEAYGAVVDRAVEAAVALSDANRAYGLPHWLGARREV